MYGSVNFCQPAISLFLIADTSFNIEKSCKLHKLLNFISFFHFWNLFVYTATDSVRLVVYANKEKCKQWRQQRFAYCNWQKSVWKDPETNSRLQITLCFAFFFLSQKWTSDKSSFLARPSIFIMPALRSFACIRVLVCQLKSSVLIILY